MNKAPITGLPKRVTLKLSDKNKRKKQLRPETELRHPKRKQLGDDHAPEFRYASSNKRVARVNKNVRL